MDELLEQFLIEGPEQVQAAGEALLALEQHPGDTALVDEAFRAIHTLKGSVGLFDLAPMGRVLHAAEDLLGAVRAGDRALDRAAVDALVAATGQTERWLASLAATEGDLPADAAAVAAALTARLRASLDGATVAAAVEPAQDTAWIAALYQAQGLDPARHPTVTALRYLPDAGCYFRGDDPVALARSVPDLLALRIARREGAPPPGPDYDPYACDLVVELLSAAAPEAVKEPFRFMADQVRIESWTPPPAQAGPVPAVPEAAARVLRVDAGRIDTLADIVDELVVAKNALSDLALEMGAGLGGEGAAQALADRQGAIDRLVGRLHRTVMGLRLVPVLPLLRRFPRVVRETASALGKEVDLAVEGSEVEVDKTIVEALFEPLTHLLRNAVDHGVEGAAARQAAAKPARARIVLSVARDADQVVITVADDGRGMDPAVIRRTAAERGVLSAAALAALSDADALDLVFRPGFSTARSVTDLSGRGVGMDAVRTAVARLGGRVAITSTPGTGTAIRLILPLTLVLTKVMVVSAGGERYGIPMDGIVETTRIAPDRLVAVRAGRAFVLRDAAVPLLELGELLNTRHTMGDDQETPVAGGGNGLRRAVIVRASGDLVAVGVDAFVDRRDVVLRPMSGLLSAMPGILGTTVMGDGQVMMVLDVPGLIAGLAAEGAP
ncbi:MAG: chemotaxis protein CheA [Azospirillaceae bacterium]|nr:chemotaxis protein CheA [Azospirillaceae bacterium]